jgi:hypothetical protein
MANRSAPAVGKTDRCSRTIIPKQHIDIYEGCNMQYSTADVDTMHSMSPVNAVDTVHETGSPYLPGAAAPGRVSSAAIRDTFLADTQLPRRLETVSIRSGMDCKQQER